MDLFPRFLSFFFNFSFFRICIEKIRLGSYVRKDALGAGEEAARERVRDGRGLE